MTFIPEEVLKINFSPRRSCEGCQRCQQRPLVNYVGKSVFGLQAWLCRVEVVPDQARIGKEKWGVIPNPRVMREGLSWGSLTSFMNRYVRMFSLTENCQGKGTTLTGYFEVCKQQSLWTSKPVTSFFECMKFTANLVKVS